MIGHDALLRAFRETWTRGCAGHAYLLVGPSAVGKATLALEFARIVLCSAAEQSPCAACVSCRAIVHGAHPDILRMSDDGTRVSVEDARMWASAIASSPLLGGWKVGILEGGDTCTEEAANALLKTLEEPPARTVLFLTAESPSRVLPTIVSRCAVLRCRRVPAEIIRAGLEARGVRAGDATTLAHAADGCPGLALAWAGDSALAHAAAERHALARAFLSGSYAERLRHIEGFLKTLSDDRAAARADVRDLLRAFRVLARRIVGDILHTGDRARAPAGVSFEHPIAWRDLVQWMAVLTRASQDLAANVAPRLILETLAVTFP